MAAPEQVSSPSPSRSRFSGLPRLALTAAAAVLVAWLCGVAMRADSQLGSPPGMLRGMVHGAIMPMAWPALLTGHDQDIYAPHNTGRLYKLGYSLGVNLSGLVFFGFLFFSLNGLRRAHHHSQPQ